MPDPILSRRSLLAAPLALVPSRLNADPAWVLVTDGVEAPLPQGYRVRPTEQGGWIEDGAAIRAPLRIRFHRDAETALHAGERVQARGDIRYTIRNMGGGGSGGRLHQLRALRTLSDGTALGMIAERQAEGRPDFAAALELLAAARPVP